VRLFLGEMGETLLLMSTRALPRRLERAGFRFRHPALEGALRAALGAT
jgi:NAD dependent epimerase/dehydratase family enzyme